MTAYCTFCKMDVTPQNTVKSISSPYRTCPRCNLILAVDAWKPPTMPSDERSSADTALDPMEEVTRHLRTLEKRVARLERAMPMGNENE